MSDNDKTTQDKLLEMEVAAVKGKAEQIVFAISRDKKYVEDLRDLIWKNRTKILFGDAYIIYCPSPNPKVRGQYILIVLNPSTELVKSIVPSPEGEMYYNHLKHYTPEHLSIRIKELYKNNKTVSEIAIELGVSPLDVEMWMHYLEIRV